MRRRLLLAAVAAGFTLLNAAKPMHVDDTYYFFHARQAAAAPLDPHGFLIFWHERPEPAGNRVASPVLPYWLSPAVRAFPDNPWAWKMWLLPFVVALVFSLDALCRRFAPGFEDPLLVLTLASPALLPSLNLMLDVPALALALLAQVAFLRASDALEDPREAADRRRARAFLWAAAAGLCGGIAVQTKYTALVVPLVWLAWSVVHQRLRLWLVAASVAALVFVSWEGFTWLSYGQSHFVRHLFRRAEPLGAKLPLLLALPSVLGAAAPGLAVLAVVARGSRQRRALVATLVVAAGFAVLVALHPGVVPISGTMVAFGLVGVVLIGFLLDAAWRLLSERGDGALDQSGPSGVARARRFLLAWLVIEVLGYVALSPFPAVRRVLGLIVVATLVLGHVAAPAYRDWPRRFRVGRAAWLSAALGVVFYGVDVLEARAHRAGALAAADWIRARNASARPFFAGHWGFQYYAERAGMRPVVAGEFRTRTPLHAGDWLVVPSARCDQQRIVVDPARVQVAHEVRVTDALPLATTPGFYSGATPLEWIDGPRLTVTVYRVAGDFQP